MAQLIPLAAPLIAVANAIAKNQNAQSHIQLRADENREAMALTQKLNSENAHVNINRIKEMAEYTRNMQTGMAAIIDQCYRREARHVAVINNLIENQKAQLDNFNKFMTKITDISERQHTDHYSMGSDQSFGGKDGRLDSFGTYDEICEVVKPGDVIEILVMTSVHRLLRNVRN
ncbi:unnamed protein product [Oppiella nova]|uniref:Uncharacterized protein n=1 Tax=Oppiella nova TaxID=334625 RepID=A0A7R9QAE8_9ACAR|nr:unnamed protein product [Oppiella nova]CAG2160826.1 unnamed protein product [Oppiella nova]